MVEFPAIPIRYEYTGDRDKAKALKGLGDKRYTDLVTAMGWQEMETGFNDLELPGGATIHSSKNYGLSTIEIHVPPVVPEEPIEECEAECLCGCGIQTGCVVVSPFSEYNSEAELWEAAILAGSWEYDVEFLPQAGDLFDIKVCKKPFKFREIESPMRSLDFFPHKVELGVFNKYFVVAEAYAAGEPQDISLIDACTWDAFHLISLKYEDTIKRCM